MNNKEIKSGLVIIRAFKDAKKIDFPRGSIIGACRNNAHLIKVLPDTISPYVSNIRCYYGMNRKSFKTSPLMVELLELTENCSSSELALILEKIIALSDETDLMEYLRKELL